MRFDPEKAKRPTEAETNPRAAGGPDNVIPLHPDAVVLPDDDPYLCLARQCRPVAGWWDEVLGEDDDDE